ncbi:unnamed protein product [Linum tenue]|uniref:Uncharacterized protein n=1 Tax=Linum tenue TaxID=586396 RepID=A0AAV0RUV0_9ROSI|nr:unnamed protein product [Linum tenue]
MGFKNTVEQSRICRSTYNGLGHVVVKEYEELAQEARRNCTTRTLIPPGIHALAVKLLLARQVYLFRNLHSLVADLGKSQISMKRELKDDMNDIKTTLHSLRDLLIGESDQNCENVKGRRMTMWLSCCT